VCGDREIVIARELTKIFETIYRGKISEVRQMIKEKGEFVVIIEGSKW
jgi:16S rRNA (cytidine1402-2'-O)-methyltransferase